MKKLTNALVLIGAVFVIIALLFSGIARSVFYKALESGQPVPQRFDTALFCSNSFLVIGFGCIGLALLVAVCYSFSNRK